MNLKILDKLEVGMKSIGDQINTWRCNNSTERDILEPNLFKTKADIKANKLIKELIASLDPNKSIISEEDSEFKLDRPKAYWLIDPIDGTASWYGGFDGYVTRISYIENGSPIYGAVYAPVLNKFWSAFRGNGAYLNGKKLSLLKYKKRFILIDNYPKPKRIAKKISDNFNIDKYIECGSLGLKSCLVADGSADLFIKDVVVRDWDIAPAKVILDEVGGILFDLNGNSIDFCDSHEKTSGLIVARDKHLASQIVQFTQDLIL